MRAPAARTPHAVGSALEPADLGVVEAAELMRARQLSAEELTESCLRRIDARNGGVPNRQGAPDQINAWAALYPGAAREQARAADARRAREGDATPFLCGIPIGIKDLYAVAGAPLTASSDVLDGNIAARDSAAWARLRGQGMVLLGHTHTHEFAAGGTTDQVGNPHDLRLIAGGSSGGSAAALAARMAPAALGTDTGGSLRIPSACCGTCAIKPTQGRIPSDGVIPLAASLDHLGPMARSVADCAALLTALSRGGGVVTPMAPPAVELGPLPLCPRPGPRPLQGVTVALARGRVAVPLAAEVAAAFDRAVHACRGLGAAVVELPQPWSLDWDAQDRILRTEVWAYHRTLADRQDRYRPSTAEYVQRSCLFTDAQVYLDAQRRRAHGTAEWERWFREHRVDVVLEPTLPILPFARGDGYARGRPAGAQDPLPALPALWNMTGMPVAALPAGELVGVSLIAPRGHEQPLVQVAIDLQAHALEPPQDSWGKD